MISKFSGLKFIHHLDHVKGTLENRHMYPVHVNIDPTNYCNHHCIWCSQHEYQQDKAMGIDYDILTAALEEAQGLGLKAVTLIGAGDATVYKRFLDLTRQISDLGLDLGMFTHGGYPADWCDHILDTFTWVRFSLDAATTEVHNHVHDVKNKFDLVVSNMRALAAKRKGPEDFTVGVQFGLHQTNWQDLVRAAELSKEAGVDYFHIKPIYKRGAVEIRSEKYDLEWEKVVRDIEKVQNLQDGNFEVYFKPYQFQINNAPFSTDKLENPDFIRHYKKCYATNFEWWIRTNLDVDICGPMHNNVGNLEEQSFASILDSDKYNTALERIDIEQCYRGCRPHYHNEAMHFLENPDFKSHINFVG